MKDTHPVLKNMKEGNLNFDPTYRYDVGTDNYDSSKKKRAPAWTDRVLLHRDKEFVGNLLQQDIDGDLPIFYGRKETTFSDHKPILSIYNL